MRILISVFSVILVTAFALFFYLLVVSRGVVAPYTDDAGHMIAGSIAEKIKVKINGVEQGMFLRGKSSENPVLLFIHGGPGVPEFFFERNVSYRSGRVFYGLLVGSARSGSFLQR